jgi:hypothetical protein
MLPRNAKSSHQVSKFHQTNENQDENDMGLLQTLLAARLQMKHWMMLIVASAIFDDGIF